MNNCLSYIIMLSLSQDEEGEELQNVKVDRFESVNLNE